MPVLQRILQRASTTVALLMASLLFVFLWQSQAASAAQTIPYKINFQGRLTDTNGNIVANGLYNIKFTIYDAASSGTNLWQEYRQTTNRVQITNGLFDVRFGDVTALSPSLFNSSTQLYLEVELPTPATATCTTLNCASFTEGPLSPRQSIAATPYAFNADTIDGIDGSNLITASQFSSAILQNGNSFGTTMVIGTNDTQAVQLEVAGSPRLTIGTTGNIGLGDVSPAALLTVGNGDLFQVNSAGTIASIGGVAHSISNSSGNLLVNANSASHLLFQTGSGNVAIGNVTPTEKLHVAGNILTTGTVSTTAGGAAGTGTQSLASNAYIQSRGMNLVANGGGLLGNNYNFSQLSFDQTETYSGGGSFKSSTANATATSDENIPVDFGKNYELTTYMKSTTYVPGNHAYVGVYQADIDGQAIAPGNHMRQAGTDTTLAAPLTPGDTTIQLTSAANWNNAAGVSTFNRSVIVWGYTNAKGYTYPNYTYSRRVVVNAYNDGGVNYGTNTITLSSPWPATWGTIPAGTAISNGSSGGTYKYTSAVNVEVPNQWTKYSGTIGGIDTTGTNRTNQFAPGTAFIRIVWLLNRDVSGNATNISTTSFTEATGLNTKEVKLNYSDQIGFSIQAASGQTADLLQVKNSVGSLLSRFDSGGNLIVSAAGTSSFAGNLTVSGAITGNGSGLTNLDATDLTGTVSDSLLSANIARLGSAANFTAGLQSGGSAVCTLAGSCSSLYAPISGSNNYIQNNTSIQSMNIAIQSASGSSRAAILRGHATQAGNIIEVQNTATTVLFGVSNIGAVNIRTTSNSANALRVQDSSSNTIFNVDTNASQITLGDGGGPFGALKSASVVWNPPSTAGPGTQSFAYDLPSGAVLIGVKSPGNGPGPCTGLGCYYEWGVLNPSNSTVTTVSLKFNNGGSTTQDPASGTWQIWYIQP